VEEKTMPLLEVKNLHVEIDAKKILNGLDLTIEKGKVHAIMGPNGSGKSTLAYVLAGKTDYQLTAGEVLFDGEDLHAAGRARRARRLPRLPVPDGNPRRSGARRHPCVMPPLARYGVTATCRASFALYNTKDEVDTLAESMVKAREFFA
jgi:ABC-type dipeptide/oligopeptide/nickel transport system ATPase component